MGVEDLYRLAWRRVPQLPPRLGYALFHAGADAAWLLATIRRQRRGVGQLRRNLARLAPAAGAHGLRALTRAGMRSYMRYFYEAFALSASTPEQRRARVRPVLPSRVRQDVERGSIVVALPHMGNWDLVGAWASAELAPVLTVAERLEPADLFEQFVAFRQGLGMRIIGQAHGQKVFDQLLEAARGRHHVIALLADRDLSSSGIEVDLAGHRAHVAAGPAALAQRLNLPLYAASVRYERLTGQRRRQAGTAWGVVLTLHEVPRPQAVTGREEVAAWTQAWVAALEPDLVAHAVDWHMLQAVFHDDLDPQRLARSRAKEREEQASDRPEPSGGVGREQADGPRMRGGS